MKAKENQSPERDEQVRHRMNSSFVKMHELSANESRAIRSDCLLVSHSCASREGLSNYFQDRYFLAEGSDCSSLMVSLRRLHPRLSSRSDVAPVLLLHRSCSAHLSRIHDLGRDLAHTLAVGRVGVDKTKNASTP